MASKQSFFVDNMTVQDILNLGDDVLSKLNKRELSRALRTVALAANKRIKRLQQYTYKKNGKIIEKKNSPGIDTSAIAQVLKNGGKFGVGNKNRNEIYQELARARDFMKRKASTVKGAVEIRKKKEKAAFGATREELTKGMNKKQKAAKIKEINELSSEVYEVYDDYQDEYEMKGGYNKDSGSYILQDIGKGMLNGMTPEEAKQYADDNNTARYEGEQANEPDFWEEINGPKEEWENW